MNKIWPNKLISPHIELGSSIERGIEVLKEYGVPTYSKNEDEIVHRISAIGFDMAIYEHKGIVSSVWYNDSVGRLWSIGKKRKIKLYLARCDTLKNWEARLNNGWIQFYFNDAKSLSMAYGIHKDVIRFNLNGV